METLDNILAQLNKLEGLSAVALVFLSCIVTGYVWRFIKFKWFPNEAIPVIVIIWGAFAMSLIADARASTMPFRVWFLRNMIVGGVIGLAAWLVHNLLLSRLEEYITKFFPSISDTVFFTKGKNDVQPPPSPPSPPSPPTPNP